jgi:hypothetical protein
MRGKNFDEQYERAKKAGGLANQSEPRAVSAQYDNRTKLIIVYLYGGNTFSFSPKWVPSLCEASAADLSNIEVTPSGAGLHWENLDEDLSVPALLQGNFGPAVAGAGSIPVDTELFENLCVQIEIAWNMNHDASVVDRLASEHPNLSADLYDFLTLLVETELMEPEAGASRQTAENTLAWLEKEGFEIVHNIVKEHRDDTPKTTPIYLVSNQPETLDNQNQDDEQNPVRQNPPQGFLGLAQERTGLEIEEIEIKMNVPAAVVKFVQRLSPDELPAVRHKIAQRGKEIGIEEDEGEEALKYQVQRAAKGGAKKRNSAPKSVIELFKELIKQIPVSVMSAEEKEDWINLAARK